MNTGKAKGIRRQIKKQYFIGLLSLPFKQRVRAAWLVLKGLP